MDKRKLLEIASALDLGSIDEEKARTLLLGLLGVSQRSELLLDFIEHLSWYYGIDEVIDCSKHKDIIERYIK